MDLGAPHWTKAYTLKWAHNQLHVHQHTFEQHSAMGWGTCLLLRTNTLKLLLGLSIYWKAFLYQGITGCVGYGTVLFQACTRFSFQTGPEPPCKPQTLQQTTGEVLTATGNRSPPSWETAVIHHIGKFHKWSSSQWHSPGDCLTKGISFHAVPITGNWAPGSHPGKDFHPRTIVYFQEGVFLAEFQQGEILTDESAQSARSVHSETHRPAIPHGDDSTQNSAPLPSGKIEQDRKRRGNYKGSCNYM